MSGREIQVRPHYVVLTAGKTLTPLLLLVRFNAIYEAENQMIAVYPTLKHLDILTLRNSRRRLRVSSAMNIESPLGRHMSRGSTRMRVRCQ